MTSETMTASTLRRVVPPFTLLLPEAIGGPSRLWIKTGGVIDVADPFVQHSVEGQAHKLRELTDDELKDPPEPTPFSSKLFDSAREAWLKKNDPAKAKPEAPAAPKPKGATGIQKPDARPRAPRASTSDAGAEGASG